jgi:hypothetical protein
VPLSKYYKGDGPQVMSSMQKRYGAKKGKQVFYATANSKPGLKPSKKKVRRSAKAKVKPAAARHELARDPHDLVLTGKGTAAQERKRDPRGYLAKYTKK